MQGEQPKTGLDNTDFFGYVDAATAFSTHNSSLRSQSMKTSFMTYLIILGGAVCWCAALLLPPLLLSVGGAWGAAGVVLYQPFHSICHQLAGRSFYIFGAPLAVCIRCSAIYFGFLLGTLLYIPARSFGVSMTDRRWLLMCSVLPMLVDVVLDYCGVHGSSGVTRLVTGGFFGIIVPFYIIPSAQEAMQELRASSQFFTPSDFKKGSIHA